MFFYLVTQVQDEGEYAAKCMPACVFLAACQTGAVRQPKATSHITLSCFLFS